MTKKTKTSKRAAKKTQPEKAERADHPAELVEGERADRKEHPAPVTRADETATTDPDERADANAQPDPQERAAVPAQPDDTTRAEHPTQPVTATRAATVEHPEQNERAVASTKPGRTKRAAVSAKPGNDARAAASAKPDKKERAVSKEEATQAERTREQSRFALKKKVRIFYDLQRLRMQTAGRTLARPADNVIALHEVDVKILAERAKELAVAEKHALRDVAEHLETLPFFVKVLSDKAAYRGIGPTMAGVILSEFDIYRSQTVSQMWAFAGLRPMPAKRCKTCHTVCVESKGMSGYDHPKPQGCKCALAGKWIEPALETLRLYDSGQAQRPTKGEKLPYNAWLRTKLVGVLADVMIKLNSPWRKLYDDYKHRKESTSWGKNDGHRHQAAKRFMIKQLLADIYVKWRTLEGLPVREPWAEEFGGRHPHGQFGVVQHTTCPPAGVFAEQPLPSGIFADDDMNALEIEAELALHEEG